MMPCYDDRPQLQAEEDAKRAAFAEAALCAILRAASSKGIAADLLTAVDWERAGVPPEALAAWWKRHKAADQRRERQESKKA